jgi:hypothetical protein
LLRIILTVVSVGLIGFGSAAAQVERVREIVAYGDREIAKYLRCLGGKIVLADQPAI